jgi:Sec-independent protein translocase protein TatA
MEILGIGAPELVFIVLIVIIVLGPKDMQKAGRTVGRWLNRVKDSEGWKLIRDTTSELRTLPNKLMREANLEMLEAQEDVRRAVDPQTKQAASQRRSNLPLSDGQDNSIQPPHVEPPAQPRADPPDKNDEPG